MKKEITADDLKPEQIHIVHNQGRCIAPLVKSFTIHWIGPDSVHYHATDDATKMLSETSLDRFLEIINQ